MSAKPTPTPWSVWVEDKTKRDDIYIAGNPTGANGGMRKLAYMVETWTKESTEANAAHIVRCVNAMPAMVEALEEATKEAMMVDEFDLEIFKKMVAALALAKGD